MGLKALCAKIAKILKGAEKNSLYEAPETDYEYTVIYRPNRTFFECEHEWIKRDPKNLYSHDRCKKCGKRK